MGDTAGDREREAVPGGTVARAGAGLHPGDLDLVPREYRRRWLVLRLVLAVLWVAASIGAAVVVPGAVVAFITVLGAWPAVGHWLGSQTATGTVLLETLLTAVLVVAGWLVLRRAAL